VIAGRPRVLAVSDDAPSLRAGRLELPLSVLRANGLIEGYFIGGSSLVDVPSAEHFDVIWLQRCRNPRLIDRLHERLDGRYLLDMDDFLLGGAAYLSEDGGVGKSALAQAVVGCAVLTTTSERLIGLLQDSVGSRLRDKAVVCPNAFMAPDAMRTPRRPRGMLIAQSDHIAVTSSAAGVLSAVCEVAQRHGLPITLVGATPRALPQLAAQRDIRLVPMGHLGYWEYHARLGAWPTLLGVCPLETVADERTLRFVRGKSDVKLVDFAGHGHPAVYSDAEPYTESDLRVGTLTRNDQEAWVDALERVLNDGWRSAAGEQALVCERRDALRVARERWLPALESARLGRARSGADLRRLLGTAGRPLSALTKAAARADELLQGRVSWRVHEISKGLDRYRSESRTRRRSTDGD
jgi:hypothetical protein